MMKNNPVVQLNELYKDYLAGKLDRRQLMVKAGALGLSATALSLFAKSIPASAQDATPADAVFPGGFQSETYAEFKARLAEDYPFVEDPAAEVTGGLVIMGEIAAANITSTNPIFADNNPTQPLMLMVFETLTGNHPATGEYVPLLGERWEIAEDGRTYTFYLQPDATWQDGTPVTADDVILSFEAQSNEATGSSYTGAFNATVESWRAIDEKTVEMVATEVFAQPIFFSNSFVPIVPAHIWSDVPFEEWQTDPGSTGLDPSRVVGSGPFRFVEIDEGRGTATFERYENHWDQAPVIDEFIFLTWPDDTAAIEGLRAGSIDFFENVPPSDVESLDAADDIDVALYDTYSFTWYGYNLDPERTTLFQDVRVRQALFYALDRQSMVDNILLGYAEVANGTQPLLSPAYNPDAMDTIYNYDPELAGQLLDEAGWVIGDDGIRERDGQRLSFQIMTASGAAVNAQVLVAMQDFWAAIGVDAQPNPVDFDTVLVPALTTNFDYELVLLGFNWDPTGDQTAMFHTRSYINGFNAMRYSNPEYDEVADAANVELDPERQIELQIEATNIINEDLPVGVLYFRQDRTAYNTRLHNFAPAAGQLLWSMPYVWVEE
jgi:peptide/nickel transport system substrate-binding protein